MKKSSLIETNTQTFKRGYFPERKSLALKFVEHKFFIFQQKFSKRNSDVTSGFYTTMHG